MNTLISLLSIVLPFLKKDKVGALTALKVQIENDITKINELRSLTNDILASIRRDDEPIILRNLDDYCSKMDTYSFQRFNGSEISRRLVPIIECYRDSIEPDFDFSKSKPIQDEIECKLREIKNNLDTFLNERKNKLCESSNKLKSIAGISDKMNGGLNGHE